MTYASVRSAAEHIARAGTITPHQLAALTALDQSMTDAQRQGFTELWRAEGSPAAAVAPIWMAPARRIVAEFEGCRLDAYLCRAGKPTIGYGHAGPDVKLGQTITQQQADKLLTQDLQRFADGIHRLLPGSQHWGGNQQAALISWAFNVGLGAVEGSTLRKRLIAKEPGIIVVPQELPKWNKAGGKPLEGLTRRRDAEVALFTNGLPVLQQQTHPNPLQVIWYAQLDSATDQGRRMCFSSSCAMLLQHLKPGTLKGPNGDDQYLKRVQQFGDTTDPAAQIKALASYGVMARFVKNAGWATLEQQITRGIPVPCGYLHRGPVTSPAGGGHWLCAVGFTKDQVIVHDPLGESDLVGGGTVSSVARFAGYSRRNFGPRWMVEGLNTGWAIIAPI